MAVTAKFAADFSDFSRGVKEADAALAKFDASAARTGTAVSRLALVTEQGVNPVKNLSTSMRQFDGALAAVGVSIGPQIRGIEDIAAASGKTATELGGFATAGLVAGAAIAGWQTGRVISEFFGLDKAIAGATASLLGWNDAAVTAAAKQDVINKAIGDGAALNINYADAIAFNQKTLDDFNAPIEAAEKLKAFEASLNATSNAVYRLTQHEKDVIRAALGVGKSHAEIAAAIGQTTDVVDLYVKETQKAAQAQGESAATADTLAKVALPAVKVATEEATEAVTRWGGALLSAIEVADQAAQMMGETLDEMKSKLDASNDSFRKLGHKTTNMDGTQGSDAGQSFERGLWEFDPAVVEQYRKMGLEDWQALNVLLGVANLWDYADAINAKKKAGAATGGSAPSGSSGGRKGARGSPGALSAPSGSSAVVVQNTFHIVDTEANIVRRVSDQITRSVLQGMKLGVR